MTVRQIVPSIGVSEGVGGEPLAVVGSVVPQEEGVAQAIDLRLAGEEGARVVRVAECGQGDRAVFAVAAERPQGAAQQVVEEECAAGGANVAASRCACKELPHCF